MTSGWQRRPTWRAAVVVACSLLAVGGCAASGGTDGGGSAPASEAPRTPAPPPPRSDLRAGAAPIFAWRCENGALIHSRYRDADGSIDLALPESVLRLDGERSASGARWRAAGVEFFSRGAEARLMRDGVTMICAVDEAATAQARAAERGVRWRGVGNEPGWVVEVDDDVIRWTTDYGARTVVVPNDGTIQRSDDDAIHRVRVSGRADGAALAVVVSETPCTDDGDRRYPLSIAVELDGATYRGCGRALEPLPFPERSLP